MPARLPARLTVIAVLAAVSVVSPAQLAHASLAKKLENPAIAADPQPASTLSSTPVAVTVVLDGPAGDPAVMSVRNVAGEEVVRGAPHVVSTNMILSLPNSTQGSPPHLPDGVYEVQFRSETSRGPEGGSYQFVMGQGAVQYQGIRTWGGYDDIPTSVALPDDAERAARAAAKASASPSTTADDNETASSGSSATASSTSEGNGDDPWWPWAAGAAVLGAVLLGVTRLVLVRRRSALD